MTHQDAAQKLKQWLIHEIAKELKVEPHSVDPAAGFEQLGLDSISMAALGGKLERFLGQRLSPSLVFEHTSIQAIVEYFYSGSRADSV